MQYEAAEKMMIQFRNERGRGVCLNNKGNTLKQMGNRFNEALNMYNLAIQNGSRKSREPRKRLQPQGGLRDCTRQPAHESRGSLQRA
ncbi:hypothetical protein BC936DRAFT_139106 [Jimgerdemannia flammicorona]|uniref:Uncharacterized protein n=1 Tax=Jimgerdemannia flammicorona TaxID=994334 RepID=A0A433BAN1_9FUNG|nr:hypothetical protein BC936DRAFT_139106 [Jimgerdemannia flammicorona]